MRRGARAQRKVTQAGRQVPKHTMIQPRTTSSFVICTAAVAVLCTAVHGRSADDRGLSLSQVNAAIDKAIHAYYAQTPPPWTFDRAYLLESPRIFNNWQVEHAVGNHCSMIWAALACGQSYQNPMLYRRINWALSRDDSGTYDRGMRLLMLAELPSRRWAPWVRRDAVVLSASLTAIDQQNRNPGGAFNPHFSGRVSPGWGDAANSQYGALGLAAAERADLRVKQDVWKRIDAYWRMTQRPAVDHSTDEKSENPHIAAAGWSVAPPQTTSADSLPFYSRVSGPMTAGAVTILCFTERLLRGEEHKLGDRVSLQLRRGVAWLDGNFKISDPREKDDWYYYIYQIQNVGRATGYRTFNGINWYRRITAELLRRQGLDGFWSGPKGKLLSTGFALLYLARANDPVAISKLRFKAPSGKPADLNGGARHIDGAWNNRPHDMWNFVDHISDRVEASTTWQIVELDHPVHELIESPLLYLSSDTSFRFSDAQIDNLRAYIEAGGMLITNPEGAKLTKVAKSVRDLAYRIFPGLELTKVAKEHPFYDLYEPVDPGHSMLMIDNGLRPLIVHMNRDIGADLQKNNSEGNGFRVLSNIYLYATSMFPRRPRLQTNFIVQLNDSPHEKLPAARLRHSGVFDPEPNSLRQLRAVLANDHDVDLQYDPKGINATQLKSHRLAFLTTVGDGHLTMAEAEALRRWVEAGGTLWIDAAGGSEKASGNVQKMFEAIAPAAQPIQLPREHPIISGPAAGDGRKDSVRYRFYALRTMGPTRYARLFAHLIDGRAAIVYSLDDLTCGLAGLDHWGIFGYSPKSARRLVVNGAMNVLDKPKAKDSPVAEKG